MQRASAISGLSEWGDSGFTEAAELLLSSCSSTAALNPLGTRVLRSVVVRHLVNRLLLNHYVSSNPDVSRKELGPAIVVTGLPRTGTTLLHNLLALDPDSRALRLWEALHPVPPRQADGTSEAELIEQAATWLEGLYDLIPSFRMIHAATAEGPEECDALLQNDFASQHFDDMFNAEAYSKWLATAGLKQQYRSYSLQLRVLGSPRHGDSHWILKSPSHLGHLDALLEACPQATVVHCHRDPLKTIPSYASLVLTLRRAYSDFASAELVGQQALNRCHVAMARAMEVRQTVPDRIVDISYERLLEDPFRTVRSLYERLGRTVTAGFEARILQWLGENRQHKHGVHHYELGQFGLTADAISTQFAPYLDRFAGALAP